MIAEFYDGITAEWIETMVGLLVGLAGAVAAVLKHIRALRAEGKLADTQMSLDSVTGAIESVHADAKTRGVPEAAKAISDVKKLVASSADASAHRTKPIGQIIAESARLAERVVAVDVTKP